MVETLRRNFIRVIVAIRHIRLKNEPRTKGFKGKCNFCYVVWIQEIICYRNFYTWLERRGTPFTLACIEYNLADVSFDAWWLDTVATIYITNYLQEATKNQVKGS